MILGFHLWQPPGREMWVGGVEGALTWMVENLAISEARVNVAAEKEMSSADP